VTDSDLHIECRTTADGWLCNVTVSDADSSTRHEVTISEVELRRYSATDTSMVELVREAFAFLLEREPKESILRRFALSDIERYFPEFGRRGSGGSDPGSVTAD